MRKITALLLCLMMLCSFAVSADGVEIEIKDIVNDIVTVKANAFTGDTVSVMIVNPGFTMQQALDGTVGAVQYYGICKAGDSGICTDIKIMGEAGGEFLVFVNSPDGESNGSFKFYNSSYKKSCIDSVNSAKITDENVLTVVENTMKAFSLDSHPLYDNENVSIVKALLALRDKQENKKFTDDTKTNMTFLTQSLIIAAYNDSKKELLTENGRLLYTQELGINPSAEYTDYLESLSDEGTKKLADSLLSENYTTAQQIADKFKELVYYHALMNYKELGYGHVQTFFDKYKDAYKKAGFNNVDKENRELYIKLLGLSSSNLKSLAADFNRLQDSSKKGTQNNGGGSSKGVGAGAAGGAVSFVEPEATPQSTPDKTFSDIDESFWGYSAINALCKDKIIDGYADGSFGKDGKITRAEFAKLIVGAFKLEKSADASFDDVKSTDWFAPYVAAAQGAKVILGSNGFFRPNDKISRQDAAVIVARAAGFSGNGGEINLSDEDEIAPYAKDAVAQLCGKKIINGFEDNTFRAQNDITRAQAAVIIYAAMQEVAQ